MCVEVDSIIKEASVVLNNEYFSRKCKVSNPKIPTLYCLPKTHKPGNKMRPIASNIRAP